MRIEDAGFFTKRWNVFWAVLCFGFYCVLCAKRSRVSIKACKPPRHSCRCIPFQVAAKSCKAGKNTAGKRRQSVQNPNFDSWQNSVLSSCYNLPLPVSKPLFIFTQPNTFLFLWYVLFVLFGTFWLQCS